MSRCYACDVPLRTDNVSPVTDDACRSCVPGSTPRFTPGPWGAEINGTEYRVEGRGNPAGTVAVITARPSLTAQADAHLIAAAPDLLDALHNAVATIRAWHGMGMNGGKAEAHTWALYQASPEMELINAAIAKAEGR